MNTPPAPVQSTTGLLSRLSRRTSSTHFIPEIDGLRFVAIAAVVAVHVASFAGGAYLSEHPGAFTQNAIWKGLQFGRFGVQIFFVLSGFVLALPFASHVLLGERKVSLKWYYLRRITRLEPPYLVSLTLFVVLLSVLPGGHMQADGQQIGSFLPHYLSGFFYLHGWTYGTMNPINILTWSLEVEVQFYVLVPLLVLPFAIRDKRVRRGFLIVACVALEFLQTVWIGQNGRLSLSLLGSLQYFLVGFLLADIYLVDWRKTEARSWPWDCATLAAIVLAVILLPRPNGFHALPFLIFLLFVGGMRGRWTSGFLRNPWIYTIGGMCYSIYLMHALVLRLGFRTAGLIGRGDNFLADMGLAFVIYVPAILLISGVFFVLIERPCMNPDWPTRILRSGLLTWRSPRAKPGATSGESTD